MSQNAADAAAALALAKDTPNPYVLSPTSQNLPSSSPVDPPRTPDPPHKLLLLSLEANVCENEQGSLHPPTTPPPTEEYARSALPKTKAKVPRHGESPSSNTLGYARPGATKTHHGGVCSHGNSVPSSIPSIASVNSDVNSNPATSIDLKVSSNSSYLCSFEPLINTYLFRLSHYHIFFVILVDLETRSSPILKFH